MYVCMHVCVYACMTVCMTVLPYDRMYISETFINVDIKRLLIGANLSYIFGEFRVKYALKYIQLWLLAKLAR